MAKITEVRCLRARPGGYWVIVKVLTDQPGLWGLGSANDVHHADAICVAIDHMAHHIIGRDAGHIEDIWQSVYAAGYWRNGALLNTALGAIDTALWDIKGKEAGMPVYDLLGGPARDAVPCYAHASGSDIDALVEDVERYIEEGYPVIRCQMGGYGGGGFLGPEETSMPRTASRSASRYFDDEAYIEAIPRMFEMLRDRIGFGPKLTHDVHEHLKPHNAVTLSKLLEPYRLYFLEDVLPPEQIQWFRAIRQQCTTPQAMGELFVNPHEYVPLITERLIDYVRVRVSKAGGITPCRKISALCEFFGVHTAWQEGGDNDPVNQAAAMHLDMTCSSFGIQEENHFSEQELEAFPGHAELSGGYLYPNDNPGLGIDVHEDKLVDLLTDRLPSRTADDRRADGSSVRP
ncbi:MAG: enolase C-terminal domain-like protein [Candidatus Latescibacterota bacterium]|nr:enolase C-terminal domain-like protein [Candidatus Latescibacterota bacterium]